MAISSEQRVPAAQMTILHPRGVPVVEKHAVALSPRISGLEQKTLGVVLFGTFRSWDTVTERMEELLQSREPTVQFLHLADSGSRSRSGFKGDGQAEALADFVDRIDAAIVGLGA